VTARKRRRCLGNGVAALFSFENPKNMCEPCGDLPTLPVDPYWDGSGSAALIGLPLLLPNCLMLLKTMGLRLRLLKAQFL